MSSSFNIQHILDTTINELFNSSNNNNNSENPLFQQFQNINFNNYSDLSHNNIDDVLVEDQAHVSEHEEDNNSMPDLIPLDDNNDENIQNDNDRSNSNELQMWTNLVEDYNAQINTYQQNIQTILRITEGILRPPRTIPITRTRARPRPINRNNTNTNTDRRNLISQLRNWFQGNDYVLEFENITPLFLSTNTNTNNSSATSQEIQNATELFVYDPRNILAYTTCPISLEEFREGEPLMRIYGCGHIFKAFELQRWFLRNTKCPTCRYNIRTSSSSSVDISNNNNNTNNNIHYAFV